MRRWLVLALVAAAWFAAPVMAQQPSQACRVACRVSQATPSPDQRHCLAQCMAGQSITRDAPGQARPSGSQAMERGASAARGNTAGMPAPTRAGPARTTPTQASAPSAPPPVALPGGRAAGASIGTSNSAGNFGAVYLAIPPNMAYGIAVGQRDRLTAHRVAEGACRNSGANCVMAEDLMAPCAAVAEGVRRAPGAFFMTSDPKTYIIRAITFRSGTNRADAERDALEVCRFRERGALTCRIVQAQCAGR
jgi:hypothetical protein